MAPTPVIFMEANLMPEDFRRQQIVYDPALGRKLLCINKSCRWSGWEKVCKSHDEHGIKLCPVCASQTKSVPRTLVDLE